MVSQNVIVMNEDTWNDYRERVIEMASKQETDQIAFILKYSSVEIVIDNSIPYGRTEVWNRNVYSEYKAQREKGDQSE